jgi:hypothetical protein
MSLVIGQAKTPDEHAKVQGAGDHRRIDRIQPQLRSAKERETLRLVDGAPGERDR